MCQVSLKMRYCGHLYSSLLCKQTWVGHRDQSDIYKEECEDNTFPSAIHLCFLSSTVGYTSLYSLQCSTPLPKVSIRPCLLRSVLRNTWSKEWLPVDLVVLCTIVERRGCLG